MTIPPRSLAAAGKRRRERLLAGVLVLVTAVVVGGCGQPPQDVTSNPTYGNFAAVTGRWKTKKACQIVQHEKDLLLYTADYAMSDGNGYRVLATLPPGTELSVERAIRQPSYECDTFTLTGSLVTGPYAGKTLSLGGALFVYDPHAPANAPSRWRVNPDELEK